MGNTDKRFTLLKKKSILLNGVTLYRIESLLENIQNPFNREDGSFIKYIAASTGIYPLNGKYIFYKRVNKISDGIYKSIYDNKFLYKDNEISEVKKFSKNIYKANVSGLHVSHPFHWNEGDTLIMVEVDEKDIITCIEGKIRVKKLKVLGEVKHG